MEINLALGIRETPKILPDQRQELVNIRINNLVKLTRVENRISQNDHPKTCRLIERLIKTIKKLSDMKENMKQSDKIFPHCRLTRQTKSNLPEGNIYCKLRCGRSVKFCKNYCNKTKYALLHHREYEIEKLF